MAGHHSSRKGSGATTFGSLAIGDCFVSYNSNVKRNGPNGSPVLKKVEKDEQDNNAIHKVDERKLLSFTDSCKVLKIIN